LDEQSSFFTLSPASTRSGKAVGVRRKPLEDVDPWYFERSFYARGLSQIVGVDEAGRGPLAGPVVAACVHLPNNFDCSGIDDSKKLTAAQREVAYARIGMHALAWTVGIVSCTDIDRLNILQATHLAMHRAVESLSFTPEVVLIDGRAVPPMADCEHLAIVGGDGLSISIAAASIVAKVTRDRLMVGFAELYPAYGFDKHKGYGCQSHLDALRSHGPCPIHRRSFAPVAALTDENNLF
jgi:ribonuclease HII